jgi:hypothetical protein
VIVHLKFLWTRQVDTDVWLRILLGTPGHLTRVARQVWVNVQLIYRGPPVGMTSWAPGGTTSWAPMGVTSWAPVGRIDRGPPVSRGAYGPDYRANIGLNYRLRPHTPFLLRDFIKIAPYSKFAFNLSFNLDVYA